MAGCPDCGFAFVEVSSDPDPALPTWGYDESAFASAGDAITAAAERIAEIVRSQGANLRAGPEPDRWSSLEVAYLFPEASRRTLRWVAAHTAHEAVHHLHDIDGTARTS